MGWVWGWGWGPWGRRYWDPQLVAPSVEAITTTDTTAAITTTTTGVASAGSARQKAEIPGSSFPAVAPAPVERGRRGRQAGMTVATPGSSMFWEEVAATAPVVVVTTMVEITMEGTTMDTTTGDTTTEGTTMDTTTPATL